MNFPEPMRPVRNAADWVNARTASVERLLWSKTCAECHTIVDRRSSIVDRPASIVDRPESIVDRPASSVDRPALPQIAPTNIPAGWMPRARFDHAAHQLTSCTSCHAAQTSRLTSDVLMPAIATCQQCHKPSRGAESRCFECHEYHDWKNAKPVRPGFSLDQLVN